MIGSLWFKSYAAGNGAAAAYELISTVFGTGSTSTVTFTSIPQTYKHLQVRFASNANYLNGSNPWMQFNGDTAANYAWHVLSSDGTSVTSGATPSTTWMLVGRLPNNGAVQQVGISVIDILDYTSTTKNKTIRSLGGTSSTADRYIRMNSGVWLSTAAVTSLTLSNDAASWPTTSRFSLYGVRG